MAASTITSHAPLLSSWPVAADCVLAADTAASLYEIYLQSFRQLRVKAAARHCLSPEEFRDDMRDERITKYTVWRGPQDPVALATVTTDLNAVTWISPAYYRRRHPEHAARQAIHYLGYALVTPGRGQYRLLERLVHEAVKPCVAQRGVLAYDVCAFNEQTMQLGRRSETLLRRLAAVRVEAVDTQTYYEASFL